MERDLGLGRVEYLRFVGLRGVVGGVVVSRRDSLRMRFMGGSMWSARWVEGDRWRGAERKMYSIGIGFGEA